MPIDSRINSLFLSSLLRRLCYGLVITTVLWFLSRYVYVDIGSVDI